MSKKSLEKVLQLGEDTRQKAEEVKPTLAELGLPHTFREVIDKTAHEVREEVECIFIQIAQEIRAGRGFSFDVPSRARSNQLYVPELDRIVLKDSILNRSFGSVATNFKAVVMARVLQQIMELCNKGINTTKRDLFYTDVKLFEDQANSDGVLDDIACMLSCTRNSLRIVASEKGIVIGSLLFRDSGDLINCAAQGVGGKGIPSSMDRVTDISSDAKFILLVEKDAAFMRLAEDRFYRAFPCIIMTAKGQPDVASRMFLRKIQSTLKIPVLALVDADPYGLKILSVYMKGSMAMSYDSANLTTPDIKWLGLRPSDLDKYKINKQCRLEMTEEDLKIGRKLLEEDFVKANPAWVKELEIMVNHKVKAEIQALSSLGTQYLTETYLPQKISSGDWI